MRGLLDTCTLSELGKPDGDIGVRRMLNQFEPEDLFLSVVTIAEIAKGIALLETSRRKRALHDWLHAIERGYQERILSVDLEISQIWGEITAITQRRGRVLPAGDGLIAATAIRHGLHVVTRNVEHFEAAGVVVINPWIVK